MSENSFQFMPGDLTARAGNGLIYWWCPGCRNMHAADTLTPNASGAKWSFSGSLAIPTLNPSVLLRIDYGTGRKEVCHCFIRAGRIEFCADSTHALAGQTVPMEVPDELR